jgi:hypothetical protein
VFSPVCARLENCSNVAGTGTGLCRLICDWQTDRWSSCSWMGRIAGGSAQEASTGGSLRFGQNVVEGTWGSAESFLLPGLCERVEG